MPDGNHEKLKLALDKASIGLMISHFFTVWDWTISLTVLVLQKGQGTQQTLTFTSLGNLEAAYA